MSEKPKSNSRHDAAKMMLGRLAAVALVKLVGLAAARAAELSKVDPATDPHRDRPQVRA